MLMYCYYFNLYVYVGAFINELKKKKERITVMNYYDHQAINTHVVVELEHNGK